MAASSYSRVWKRARELAFVAEQVSSVLAARPYDLRHAGVSRWLNSGVPAPEVAARAGHSVEVLLKIYAACIDGQEREMNQRIMRGLGRRSDVNPVSRVEAACTRVSLSSKMCAWPTASAR